MSNNKETEIIIGRVRENFDALWRIADDLGILGEEHFSQAYNWLKETGRSIRSRVQALNSPREYRRISGKGRNFVFNTDCYFAASYTALVQLFGEPVPGKNEETHFQWYIESDTGQAFRLYDEARGRISKEELQRKNHH